MPFTIDRLQDSARSIITAHFLALSVRDRYLRFSTAAPTHLVTRYVETIDFSRDVVLGMRDSTVRLDERGALVGVAHTAFEGDLAEFGVSVLPSHRGQGLGSALLDRAVALARSRGMRRLWMQFLAHNVPITRIARKIGMRIVLRGIHSCAHLDLSGRFGPDTNETRFAWT
jgi:GNAT superfamily N-acetyltransferase